MVNLEKIYRQTATRIIQRCHGAIKVKKRSKMIEVYDPQRHFWSTGIAGLIIKEECINSNLREWEYSIVRTYVIEELLKDSSK